MARADKFIKFTEEDLEAKSASVLIGELCKSSREVFEEMQNNFTYDLLYSMENCESPIEQIMALRLHEFRYSRQAHRMEFIDGLDIIEIHKQHPIKTEGKKFYRVDFMIAVYDKVVADGMCFVIECDGHDFHEKTKEQAKKDKLRDRELVTDGYVVMRYTGSEIYGNSRIADEIFQRIKTIMLNRRDRA